MQITPVNSHSPCTQLFPHYPCTWPHPVTPARGFCAAQLNLRSWVNLTPLHGFAESTTFSERQRPVVLARDVSRDFFRSRQASPLINLVFPIRWTVLHQENRNNNTSAIRVNIVALKDKEKDLYKIICYNCNNKRYYTNACLDPLKAKN